MNLEVVLKQKQTQQLAMTQEMQQAIHILGMDSSELKEYITELAMENPAIELEHLAEDDGEALRQRKKEWLEEQAKKGMTANYTGGYHVERDLFAFEKMASTPVEETLRDYLERQVNLSTEIPEREVVTHLVHCLDEDGYLRYDRVELVESFGGKITAEQLAAALGFLQTLDPKGVGAANLGECLCLQLGAEETLEREIATQYLEWAAQKQYRRIAEEVAVTEAEVQRAYRRIQELNPKPGNGFHVAAPTNYNVPDIVITKFQTHYTILPCEFIYPRIQLNEEVTRLAVADKEAKEYLSEKVKQVEWVQKSMKNRAYTLVEVVKVIVERQEPFFRNDSNQLNILSMADVAGELGMHESTVSRAVRGKYLQCHRGIYLLRYFFVQGTRGGEQKGEEVSSRTIKVKIGELIGGESGAKPYSDQKLAELLSEDGCQVSRRTVAKYRNELGLLKSNFRKQ